MITSKEEFFSFLNCYSPDFIDDFFSNNALIVVLTKENAWEIEDSISYIGVQNNVLYANIERKFIGNDSPVVSPAAPTWCLICKINKADISGINKIVCTSNRAITIEQ